MLDMDKSFPEPSELQDVDAAGINHVSGVVDINLKLPSSQEDKTEDDQTKGIASGKIFKCEDTESDSVMHDKSREEKDPSLNVEEDKTDKLTSFDPKDFKYVRDQNEVRKDSVSKEIQENHNGQSMAVEEEKKRKKKETKNVDGEVEFKFKNLVQKKEIYKPFTHREHIHEESFDNFTVWMIIIIGSSEISIEYIIRQVIVLQRNNQVFVVVWRVQQTFCRDFLDRYELFLSGFSSPYSSSRRVTFQMHSKILSGLSTFHISLELPCTAPERGRILISGLPLDPRALSSRRNDHETKYEIPYALMADSRQSQSEQHSFTKNCETTDISPVCDVKNREVTQNGAERDLKSAYGTQNKMYDNEIRTERKFSSLSENNCSNHDRMKNTQHQKILKKKHRDTDQHTGLKLNINCKKFKRYTNQQQALKSLNWQEQSTLQETIDMQGSYEKGIFDFKTSNLKWQPDHPSFRKTIWTVNAVPFKTEGIPPRTQIVNNNQLPTPALPLTRFSESNCDINVPAASVGVPVVGQNFTARSAQEQLPSPSSETQNTTSVSSRAWDAPGPAEFPAITPVDQRNENLERSSILQLMPSKEAAALKRMNSGSEEAIPRVHSHPVDESAESEANNRPTFRDQLSFPSQTAIFIHDWSPYLDQTSQQIAEAGSIFSAAAFTPGNNEIQKYLFTVAAQSVLDMGCQLRVVLLAIERVLMNRVGEEITGQMIMEAVFEIEEDEERKCQFTPSSELEQGNDSTGTGDEEAEGACGEEFPIDLLKMKEYGANLCIICQLDTISRVFLPCGHAACCLDCAVTARKCPICGTLISQYVTVFSGGNKPV